MGGAINHGERAWHIPRLGIVGVQPIANGHHMVAGMQKRVRVEGHALADRDARWRHAGPLEYVTTGFGRFDLSVDVP